MQNFDAIEREHIYDVCLEEIEENSASSVESITSFGEYSFDDDDEEDRSYVSFEKRGPTNQKHACYSLVNFIRERKFTIFIVTSILGIIVRVATGVIFYNAVTSEIPDDARIDTHMIDAHNDFDNNVIYIKRNHFKVILIDIGVSTAHELDTLHTPQRMALDWLMKHDPAQLLPLEHNIDRSSYIVRTLLERYALVVLYFSTTEGAKENVSQFASGWRKGDGWITTSDSVCLWHGVQCGVSKGDDFIDGIMGDERRTSENEAVVKFINLKSNGLNGTIPGELKVFRDLLEINLANNTLKGTIPSELSSLERLTMIDFSSNQLSGSIPPKLSEISAIKSIYLENNRITGTIPEEFKDSSTLEILSLEENRLVGSVPDSICDLPRIHRIDVDDSVPCNCCF